MGKKSKNDFMIFTQFPRQPFPHSLEFIGQCLRYKSYIEDDAYPPPARGKHMLLHFCQESVLKREKTIKEICCEFNPKCKNKIKQGY
jgi:hypothetical protein